MKNYSELFSSIKSFIFDYDGVLTDGKVFITNNGDLLRTSNVKDGYAIKYALTKNYKIAIISGCKNEGVRKRIEQLGVSNIYLGVDKKIDAYYDFINKNNLDPKAILYLGDDIPDIPVINKVGISCCPADAASDVKSHVNFILDKKGGEGCVRAIIEDVLRVQGNWEINF